MQAINTYQGLDQYKRLSYILKCVIFQQIMNTMLVDF